MGALYGRYTLHSGRFMEGGFLYINRKQHFIIKPYSVNSNFDTQTLADTLITHTHTHIHIYLTSQHIFFLDLYNIDITPMFLDLFFIVFPNYINIPILARKLIKIK